MRDQEFKQKLTEVADWHTPIDIDTGSGQHNKLKKLEKLRAQGEQIGNDTYPPELLRVKCQSKACDDCGKIVEGRKVEIQFYKNKNIRGRKEKCVNCGLHKDPYTGKFCLTGTEASIKWNSFAKKVNRRYQKPTLPKVQKTTVVYESDTERITNHCDIFHCDK